MLDWQTAAVLLGVIASILAVVWKIIPGRERRDKSPDSPIIQVKLALLEAENKNIILRLTDLKVDMEKFMIKVDKKFEDLDKLIRDFIHDHGT